MFKILFISIIYLPAITQAQTIFSIHHQEVQYAPFDLSIIEAQAESSIWKKAFVRCLEPIKISPIRFGSVIVDSHDEIETVRMQADSTFKCLK